MIVQREAEPLSSQPCSGPVILTCSLDPQPRNRRLSSDIAILGWSGHREALHSHLADGLDRGGKSVDSGIAARAGGDSRDHARGQREEDGLGTDHADSRGRERACLASGRG